MTEGYEHAQLIAEVGIIIASLAVLLNNKPAWFASIGIGVLSLVWIGNVYLSNHTIVETAEHQVEHASETYKALRRAHTGDNSDADAVAALDPTGAIRSQIAAAAPAPAAHDVDSHGADAHGAEKHEPEAKSASSH